jgi:hypothetical protein
VIEHLDDPEVMLARAAMLARPGGLVVGTVPAMMALWSRIDEQSGHKTRYSVAELRRLLASLPLALIEIAPFFRSLVPLLWVQRRLVTRRPLRAASVANLRVPAWPVNRALGVMVSVEHRLTSTLDIAKIPGASLWFALRRP